MKIREYDPVSDFESVSLGLRDLINLVAAEDQFIERLAYVFEGDNKLRQLLQFLKQLPDASLMVAESEMDEEFVIGFIAYYVLVPPDSNAYSHQSVTVGVVHELWVDELARGRGVGRLLMDTARTHFKKRRCSMMQVRVLVANEDACRFYESIGMEQRIVEYSEAL